MRYPGQDGLKECWDGMFRLNVWISEERKVRTSHKLPGMACWNAAREEIEAQDARIAALESEVAKWRDANARNVAMVQELEESESRLTQVNAQMLAALEKSLVALRRAKHSNLGNETYWKVIDTVPDVERAIDAARPRNGEGGAA